MSTERFYQWLPAALIALTAVGILATGIGFTARSLYLANPPAAIRTASLPVSAPTPHGHCPPYDSGVNVPLRRIGFIRPKDYGSFGLALQEYAHRQGGCSRYINRRVYRLQLPQPAIDQILALDRHTYADWAGSVSASATSATSARPRYIDLYFIYATDRNAWMLAVGIALIVLGILAGVVALMFGSVTYDEIRQQAGQATQTAPTTAGSHPRSS